MKSAYWILLFVGSISQLADAATTWTCKKDASETSKFIEGELNRKPWAKGKSGDDGAITETNLNQFEVNVDGKNVSGTIITDVDGAEKVHFNSDKKVAADLPDLKDFSVHSTKTILSKDKKLKFTVSFDGYDHYSHRIYLDTEGVKGDQGTVFVREDFDFDCGGDGSRGFGLFICTVK